MFAHLQKVCVSFLVSACVSSHCLSVYTYHIGSNWADVCEIQGWRLLLKSDKESQVWLKFGKNNGHCT
jgi:hypothetical protein